MAFKKAERRQVKLKLALAGPSGSGKTYSALRLAKGIGGKIAGLDTENGSMSLYSDDFEFDVEEIHPPFTIEKYTSAIREAEKLGYTTIVVDSISHAWAGEGGLLEQKEALDNRGGKQNKYTNWASITKKHEAFKSAILQSGINVICTMRSKQEYAQVEEGGSTKIKKMGAAPVQREGIEYEFTTVFDIGMDHSAEASKDRTKMFPPQEFFKITEETGERFRAWRDSAKAEEPAKPAPPAPPSKPAAASPAKSQAVWAITKEKVEVLTRTSRHKLWEPSQMSEYIQTRYKRANVTLLQKQEYDSFLTVLATLGPTEAFDQLKAAEGPPQEEAPPPNMDELKDGIFNTEPTPELIK